MKTERKENHVAHFLSTDDSIIKNLRDRIGQLYQRIARAHENVEAIVESIMIWGQVPLYQRRESSVNSLLDIEDRSSKQRNRSFEVKTSKKLIEQLMEENYRLLFDLSCPEPNKGHGKERLRKTIIRQLGRKQVADKMQRTLSLVTKPKKQKTK